MALGNVKQYQESAVSHADGVRLVQMLYDGAAKFLRLARQAVEQLAAWAARPDWNDVLSNFARCVRITREYKDVFPLDVARDADPSVRQLHEAY